MTFPVDELNSEYTTLSTLKTLKTPRQRIASSFRNGNDCCAVQVKLREAEKVRCGPLFSNPSPPFSPHVMYKTTTTSGGSPSARSLSPFVRPSCHRLPVPPTAKQPSQQETTLNTTSHTSAK